MASDTENGEKSRLSVLEILHTKKLLERYSNSSFWGIFQAVFSVYKPTACILCPNLVQNRGFGYMVTILICIDTCAGF